MTNAAHHIHPDTIAAATRALGGDRTTFHADGYRFKIDSTGRLLARVFSVLTGHKATTYRTVEATR